jgi:hypothetical protein
MQISELELASIPQLAPLAFHFHRIVRDPQPPAELDDEPELLDPLDDELPDEVDELEDDDEGPTMQQV